MGKLVFFDTSNDGFGKREFAGGGFVADMFAIVGNVGGGDAAAILEHNGVGGRRRHGEQEQSREWRCALHIPILAMARAQVLAALLVYA